MRYFDSSILAKLYLPEPNSPHAAGLVRSAPHPIPVTPLHEMEVRSAIRLNAGRGAITPADCTAAIANFSGDFARGIFIVATPDWPAVFARSESLSHAHAATVLCRTLDTLHVALALEMNVSEFATFDNRQAALARLAGFAVIT